MLHQPSPALSWGAVFCVTDAHVSMRWTWTWVMACGGLSCVVTPPKPPHRRPGSARRPGYRPRSPPPHAGCSRLPRAHACTLPPHAACRSHTSHADTLIAMHTRLSSPRRDAASPPPLAYPHARGLPPAPRRRSLTHPRAG